MKAVIQRVVSGSVVIEGNAKKSIGAGLVVLLGISYNDTENDAVRLAEKIVKMRIFSDADGKMNLSVLDVQGDVLVISQFTLCADIKKGNRPSFNLAARPDVAVPLYEKFINVFSEKLGKNVVTGKFGASMLVDIQNDGPVTIVIDTQELK
ncbi:MAG: D-tyrosyl-tRNA(Tyr) deacylase [Treponema sp.]|nr:MAG: D-tyrosyl-tRNA(Tyr) deacylase [Treponema sp.]